MISMESLYYSKKLKQYFSKRLDFLIYAHDGRGLGHASRSIAIGLALRRLYPKCKTLFISGCKDSATLIGNGKLDWIKLPSYTTTIIKGRAEGGYGDSNFYKSVLGELRRRMLASIIKILQPRVVLVDQAPMGKKNELVQALKDTNETDIRWILGLRGIIGDDKDVWSDESIQCFKDYYESILWYGNTRIVGRDSLDLMAQRFDCQPIETGYVSRLIEVKHFMIPEENGKIAGTISIPWGTESTWKFIKKIHEAIESIGAGYGQWRIFVEQEKKETIRELFKDLAFCIIHEVSEKYIQSLAQSKLAIVYAGYNSISDILASRVPSIVVLRDLNDSEQQTHVDRLLPFINDHVTIMSESNADVQSIRKALTALLNSGSWEDTPINMDGAEVSAIAIAKGIICEEAQ